MHLFRRLWPYKPLAPEREQHSSGAEESEEGKKGEGNGISKGSTYILATRHESDQRCWVNRNGVVGSLASPSRPPDSRCVVIAPGPTCNPDNPSIDSGLTAFTAER